MVHPASLIYTHLHRGHALRAHRTLATLTCGLLVGLMAGAGCGLAESLSEPQSQLEQQLAALISTSASSSQQQPISTATSAASTTNPGEAGTGSNSGSRSRSPRSIGDMFKKLFNANKRSKSQQSSNSREWDQLQQQAALQQSQQQQQAAAFQNQMVASSLAAAAANQHAVYASPFATYASSYSPYSGAGLFAWPSSSLAQALRATTPTLLAPAGSPVSLSSPSAAAGSLYAAASQPYTAYAAPPPGIIANQQQQPLGPASSLISLTQQQQQQQQQQQPMVAASLQHVSAVPPPATGHHQPAQTGGNLDFHQVLDALVRSSGFAPAGDQEAAAAQGYEAKEGTPVFSFKKLVSLPFYLSTDEKSLDTLAPAAHSAGYSLHSMPIMRRHVRRMSTPSHLNHHHHHLNQQLSQQMQLGNLASAPFQTDPSARSEREQQLRYSSYFNALNNQLASMTANNQLMQYLTRQQNQPSIASQVEAFAADAALANYQQPFKSSSRSSAQQQQQQMAMAASTVVPMAVAAPQSLMGPPKEAGEREFQALLSSIQMQNPSALSTLPVNNNNNLDNGAYYGAGSSSFTAMEPATRFGPQSAAPQYYWPRESPASSSMNSNGNVMSQRDYLSLMGSSNGLQQPGNLLGASSQQQVAQNNALLLQEQQQQQQQQSIASASGLTQSQIQSAVQQQQQQSVEQQQQPQSVSNSQQQSAMNTQSQQQQQQQSLVPQGTQRDGTGAASSAGFTQTSAQIEGQQK